jgi:coenzyme F420-reducing hydrogenase delta subunit
MKRRDNVQKITHIMVNYPGGPLAQAFVLEAVRQYADQVLAAGKPEDDPRSWINPQVWYNTAAMISESLQTMEADNDRR